MGLLIGTFKKNGNSFTDSYAKVGEVSFNNTTKIATFNLEIFASSAKDNLICTIEKLFVKINAGTDIVAQCYGKLTNEVTTVKALIAKNQAEADLIVDGGDTMKLVLESKINTLKNREILQLDGAVSDEIVG